ncbi:zinc knuckle, partial [Cooperia oncophora]
MPRRTESTPQSLKNKPDFQSRSRPPFCFYCDSKEHWSTECSKIITPKARLEYLKKNNRCIGCGSKTHSFAECKAKGILAYAIRFLKGIIFALRSPLRDKLRKELSCIKEPNQGHHLTVYIREAHNVLVRNHQAVHLSSHYKKELSKTLNIKEDRKNLLRAYGRLNKSDLSSMAKNPILIAPHTEFSRLIVLEAHGKYHNS